MFLELILWLVTLAFVAVPLDIRLARAHGIPPSVRPKIVANIAAALTAAENDMRERCAQYVASGVFLHDDSPEARWARRIVQGIRALEVK